MALKEITALETLTNITDLAWLHAKLNGVDYKVRPQVLFDLYNARTAGNEANRSVTPTEIGLGNLTNNAQLEQQNNLSDLTDVAAARTSLDTYSKTETDAKIQVHVDATDNPHQVTKDQIDLANVPNFVATSNIGDDSETKFATINAVYQVNQKVEALIPNVIPKDTVLMWMGDAADVPDGWAILDGLGHPIDMRGKFPRGGDQFSVGDEGGQDTYVHSHSATIAGHALTMDEMPQHQHPTAWGERYGESIYGNMSPQETSIGSGSTDTDNYQFLTGGAVLNPTGGGATNKHKYDLNDATICDAHTHTATVSDNAAPAESNVPKYRTVLFIIKL